MPISDVSVSFAIQATLAGAAVIYAVHQLVVGVINPHIPPKDIHLTNVIYASILFLFNFVRFMVDFCGTLFAIFLTPFIAGIVVLVVVLGGIPTVSTSESCANFLAVVTVVIGLPALIESYSQIHRHHVVPVVPEVGLDWRSYIIQFLLAAVAICYTTSQLVVGIFNIKTKPDETHLMNMIYVGVMLILTIMKFGADFGCTHSALCVAPFMIMFIVLYAVVVYYRKIMTVNTSTSCANFMAVLSVFVGLPAVWDAYKKARANLPVPAVPEVGMVNFGSIE